MNNRWDFRIPAFNVRVSFLTYGRPSSKRDICQYDQHAGGCLDLTPEVPGQSEEHSLRYRVQGRDVRESASVRSECESKGPGTLTIRLGQVYM
jgi:hypothetical protein